MRRIDVVGITVGLFVVGGLAYLLLETIGLDSMSAGIWSQVLLVGALIVWLVTYLTRVLSQNMTYNQQLEDYREAVLKKRFEELTPEELAKLQAEVEADRQKAGD
ncbi:MAG: DUF3007 family protein [Leptolyngbyaceae cyanobacterium CSU_1_3]|nr:DUF3007 family protein [Leptolyngbyaceae cyanobacterium CSU_1_3]